LIDPSEYSPSKSIVTVPTVADGVLVGVLVGVGVVVLVGVCVLVEVGVGDAPTESVGVFVGVLVGTGVKGKFSQSSNEMEPSFT
jgi:hypothetical protein